MGSCNVAHSNSARLFSQEAVALPAGRFLDSSIGMRFLRRHWDAPHDNVEPELPAEPDRRLRVLTRRVTECVIDVNEQER
jgi:hypothetical protein